MQITLRRCVVFITFKCLCFGEDLNMEYVQSFRSAITGKIWPVTVREVHFKDYSDAETPLENAHETHTAGISFVFLSSFTNGLKRNSCCSCCAPVHFDSATTWLQYYSELLLREFVCVSCPPVYLHCIWLVNVCEEELRVHILALQYTYKHLVL